MPLRNEVESLQTVCTRRVAWPDGINRDQEDEYPSIEQYCRDTIYCTYVSDNFTMLQKWLGIDKLKDLTNKAVNTWIQLSNHHSSTLADFKHLEPFLKMYPETLDFLQQGIPLIQGSEEKQNKDVFQKFILVVPQRSITQKLTATSWNSIMETLKTTEAGQKVKELCVEFEQEQRSSSSRRLKALGSLISRVKHVESYNFGAEMECFSNLTKLVVRGLATDDFLKAVGTHCHRLKHLDICRSSGTIDGVRFLFFKDKEAEIAYVQRFKSSMAWNLPKYNLRPLTKTLIYFDMADMQNITDNPKVLETIKMACPQLVATPAKLFFCPNGEIKINCKNFDVSQTLMPLRQILVLHVRTKFCEDIFCFVRGLLACSPTKSPSFQVRVDESGCEIGFLLFSDEKLIAYCELENLTVINFTSHTKSTMNFIPIEIIGHFAPKLQRLKAPLKGALNDKYPLKYLKHVAIPVAHDLRIVASIVQQCPYLQYLEVRELLLHPDQVDDEDICNIFEDGADNLQTFRLLFKNKISLLGGLTHIIRTCPEIQILGDLKYWAVTDSLFYRLHKQVNLHNFWILLEYNGVLYNSGEMAFM